MANQPATIYRLWQDGLWHHPTLPDIDPGTGNPDPGTSDLWFGTTLFGSSWFFYKSHTISGGNNRLNQLEYDLNYNDGSGTKRGTPVIRTFDSGVMASSYSSMISPARATQGVHYSWKDGANVDNSSESTFKNRLRTIIDGRPVGDKRPIWLTFHHEWDNDANMGDGNNRTGAMLNWYTRQGWIRDVLDGEGGSQYAAAAYKNGGWIKFGPISVGSVFDGRSPTSPRGWKTYTNGALEVTGRTDVKDLWDFWGCDRYNTVWDKPKMYWTWPEYSDSILNCINTYQMPFVIGESGSALSSTDTGTLAQRHQRRADYLNNIWGHMRDEGTFDLVSYWRVPSNSNNMNAWSTNMATPNGYNATVPGYAGSAVAANGGFDDQILSDLASEYTVGSAIHANELNVGPQQFSFYTGGGGFG